MTCERMADLLDVYLDGEADALTARGVEEHLAECANCSRQLAARRALQQALREKLQAHRAPAAVRERALKVAAGNEAESAEGAAGILSAVRIASRPARSAVWRYAVAAGVALAIGLGVGFVMHTPARSDALAPIVAAVETDHLRSLQEGHLMDVVSTDQHTVKPWFAGRVAFSPAVPDLGGAGFPLKGGRLDWVGGQQAIALVYGRNKHVINLFVWENVDGAGLSSTAVSRTTGTGHNVVCWGEGGLNYCAISDVEAGQLGEFVTAYRNAK